MGLSLSLSGCGSAYGDRDRHHVARHPEHTGPGCLDGVPAGTELLGSPAGDDHVAPSRANSVAITLSVITFPSLGDALSRISLSLRRVRPDRPGASR